MSIPGRFMRMFIGVVLIVSYMVHIWSAIGLGGVIEFAIFLLGTAIFLSGVVGYCPIAAMMKKGVKHRPRVEARGRIDIVEALKAAEEEEKPLLPVPKPASASISGVLKEEHEEKEETKGSTEEEKETKETAEEKAESKESKKKKTKRRSKKKAEKTKSKKKKKATKKTSKKKSKGTKKTTKK